MCVDPGTLAIMSMAATAIGTFSSMAGAQQNAQAQADSANYQAAVARNNQVIADQNADYAVQKGEQNAQIRQMQTGQQMGTARAVMGASGVKIDSGSPLNVQGDIASIGELDTETIRNNAAREAYGYRTQSMGFGAQSDLDKMQAGRALRAGQTNVMTSLISGGSSIADKWSKFSTVGVPPYELPQV